MRRIFVLIIAVAVVGCSPDTPIAKDQPKPDAARAMAAAVAPVKPSLDPALEPKTFRNIPWGVSRATAHKLTPLDASCFSKSLDRIYREYLSAAEAARMTRRKDCGFRDPLRMGEFDPNTSLLFDNDRFVQATLNYAPSEYDLMLAILTDKYGRPSSAESVPMQTGGGATYVNDVATWDFDSVLIESHRYGSRIDQGVTYLTAKSYVQELAAEREDAKQKAKTAF